MPNLRIRDGSREYTYQIEAEAATVGRGETNDIDLEDAKASKEHFRIERVGQRWKLVDLESKNGTKVNGEFRNKAWLGHGDLVQVGTAEIRFGLEGAARGAGATSASSATASRRPAAARAAEEGEEGEEEQVPEPRYAKKTNLPLILSLTSLVVLVFYLLRLWAAGHFEGDVYNRNVLSAANKLVNEGRYDEAIQYLAQNGDSSGAGYPMIERRITELREGKPAYEKITREQEARAILSKVGLYIRSYNAGHASEYGPDKILPLMKQLREKYSDTQYAESARREYPAWYAGKVPQPASEILTGSGRLQKDWEAALERSANYRKDWLFREAKETVERFVTEREAILGAGDLATYEQLRDDELLKIDRLAESIYRAREAEAERFLKNKRYDDAIAAYRQVVEKFGIDAWVRRAQSEIAKIEKLKPGGG